jgi:hypothetical protein
LVTAWHRLLADIGACKVNAFIGRVPRGCPDKGYPRMIHTQLEYRERRFALMHEGYLFTKPFRPTRFRVGPLAFAQRRAPTHQDIPADPRALEPYSVRPYQFAEEFRLPASLTERDR